MEVLGTAGDSYLGGDDLDAAVARWLLDQLPAIANTSTPGGSSSSSSGSSGSTCGHPHWEWALGAAERAKVQLSAAPSATIELPGGVGTVELTQQQFEALTVELFQRMADVLEELGEYCHVQWAVPPGASVRGGEAEAARHVEQQAQAQAQQQQQEPGGAGQHHSQGAVPDRWAPPPRRVTRAVLVGQCSRLPSVRAFVAKLTGVSPDAAVDPAEAVALGAAAHAGMLLGGVGGLELMDGAYSAELHGRASGWSP